MKLGIFLLLFAANVGALCHNAKISRDDSRWADPEIVVLPLFSHCDEHLVSNDREIIIFNSSPHISHIEYYPRGINSPSKLFEFRVNFRLPHIPESSAGVQIYESNSYLNMAYFFKDGVNHMSYLRGLIEVAYQFGETAKRISMDEKYFYIEHKNAGVKYASLTVVDYNGETRLTSRLAHQDFLNIPEIQNFIEPHISSLSTTLEVEAIGQKGFIFQNYLKFDGDLYNSRTLVEIRAWLEAIPPDQRVENVTALDSVYESIALQAVDIERPNLERHMHQNGYILSALQYLVSP